MSSHRWDGSRFVPLPGAVDEARVLDVLLAESWREVDGHVRALEAHRDRFAASLAGRASDAVGAPALGGGEGLDAAAIIDAAADLASLDGEWFPRVRIVVRDAGDETGREPGRERDATPIREVLLDVRPGPPRQAEVTVAVRDPGDPRRRPRHKGPDLAWAGRQIASVRERGAGEVLVRDDAGAVLEAGWASVLWWEGEDLCVPDPGLPVLPSITRALVEERARAEGRTIRPVRAPLDALDGREAWLLNAYQGLRPVTRWVGSTITPGTPVRAAEWRAWLDSC